MLVEGPFRGAEYNRTSSGCRNRVEYLPACVTAFGNAGVTFRNEMQASPGDRQIQLEDPDGNPTSCSSRHLDNVGYLA